MAILTKKGDISIKTRLLFQMVVALIGLIVISWFALSSEKDTMLEDRKVKTRNLVETAHSLLTHYYQLQQQGVYTEAAAKEAAIKTINKLRYEQHEYFWLNDFTTPIPRMIMHPTSPALDGKILDMETFNCATSLQAGIDGPIEKTDGKKNLFVAFNEVANKAGLGYVTYDWPKPKAGGGATDKLYNKLSFVMKFDGWNWVVGSGIYMDDVDAAFWSHALKLIIITAVIIMIIGTVMALTIRRITIPLNELENTMQLIQENHDLSRRVNITANDEIGQIAQSFNQMVQNFQHIIKQVVDNARSVMQAASTLSESSSRVASRSHEQSEATTSMAATVEEMTVSINHVSERSQQTHDAAQQSGELSTQGNEVVHGAATEMTNIASAVDQSSQLIEELNNHSKQISDIASVIKGIADQTNLLALNAAIEAARAGEQGRGFAVVADEVRALAQRTTQATDEITVMIDNIQRGTLQAVNSMEEAHSRVGNGVNMANRAGDAMGQIQVSSNEVIQAINDIANALREQNAASNQVATKVSMIAQMTEENSLAANDIADEAQQLEQLAKTLENAVSRFKI
ncbi:MAG: methyl-accepting chemotaxis protein [Thiohalomonadaceae bacterium]